jgi:hypothetical protein
MGQIHGEILLTFSAAGVAGPVLMEQTKVATGSLEGALCVAAGMPAVGFVIGRFYGKPQAVASPAPKTAAPRVRTRAGAELRAQPEPARPGPAWSPARAAQRQVSE